MHMLMMIKTLDYATARYTSARFLPTALQRVHHSPCALSLGLGDCVVRGRECIVAKGSHEAILEWILGAPLLNEFRLEVDGSVVKETNVCDLFQELENELTSKFALGSNRGFCTQRNKTYTYAHNTSLTLPRMSSLYLHKSQSLKTPYVVVMLSPRPSS